MILKKKKPTTPGQRGAVTTAYNLVLTPGVKPHRSLVRGAPRRSGRITVRHRGGGHKRRYRVIDFLYDKKDIPAVVKSIEYDPNRSSFISLVCYRDGAYRYILTPREVRVGDSLIVSERAPIQPGNRAMLKHIPVGTFVYNVPLKVGGVAKLARSAGNAAEVQGHDEKYALLKLPSKEVRRVPVTCFASIGSVSNDTHRLRVIGKAGRNRWLGRRPVVRGTAMNPVDHPHGGGEGKQGRGRRRAVTKWGKPSGKGHKTRRPKRYSDALIVTKRKSAKRSR